MAVGAGMGVGVDVDVGVYMYVYVLYLCKFVYRDVTITKGNKKPLSMFHATMRHFYFFLRIARDALETLCTPESTGTKTVYTCLVIATSLLLSTTDISTTPSFPRLPYCTTEYTTTSVVRRCGVLLTIIF